jgi:hypothetical protein
MTPPKSMPEKEQRPVAPSWLEQLDLQGTSKWHLLNPTGDDPTHQLAIIDMERRKVGRDKQLAYFHKVTGQTWAASGLSEVHTAIKAVRDRALDRVRSRSAFVNELLRIEKETGRTSSQDSLKQLGAAYADVADALAAAGTPESLQLLESAKASILEIRDREQREEERKLREKELKDRVVLKTRELDQRQQTKIEAGLKQIEREVGRNAKVKAALDSIRDAMKEAA